LGRAASLETTGVGAAAREEQEEEVVLSDLPPTYSQIDLASPPPSYGPELEMVVVAPPPNYTTGELNYQTLLIQRQELPIDEISQKWEEMRVN